MPTAEFPAQAPIKPAQPPAKTGEVVPRSPVARAVVSHALSRWAVLGVLFVLLLASLLLRVRALSSHFWIDEGLSVGISSHHFGQIPSLMREDGSPPLYYLLLHVWMALRGRSEVATHELSLIFALLSIPVAYWAGASLFDRRTGVLCGVLAAGAPYLTIYAQETRMYSLLALLALVIAASFVHVFVRRRRGYLPVFVVALTAALYTHNWALFLGLMTAAAFLLCVRASPSPARSLWRDGALAFGGAALLYAPWIPTVVYQARHTGAPWSLPPVVWSLSQGLYSVVGGRGVAVALLFGAGAGLFALRQRQSGEREHGQREDGEPQNGERENAQRANAQNEVRLAAGCLLVLGIGTLLTAWVYSKLTPAWAPRYLAVIVGPLILLFGLGLARAGRLGVLALALSVCFWVLDPMPGALDTKSNVASAIAKVRSHVGSKTLVLSTQPEDLPTIAYYLRGASRYGTTLGPVADPRIVDWRDALHRLRRSSVNATLMPMVTSLAPGERVVLVMPVRLPSTPLWMKLINRASNKWAAALERDPALERIAMSAAHANAAGVPVRAMVFVQRRFDLLRAAERPGRKLISARLP